MINITGLDKAEVLAALYNQARPQGMGFMHYEAKEMTTEEARELLEDPEPTNDFGRPRKSQYFDYIKGRVMKVNLEGDSFREDLYDRDNGPGAAARALAPLRAKQLG